MFRHAAAKPYGNAGRSRNGWSLALTASGPVFSKALPVSGAVGDSMLREGAYGTGNGAEREKRMRYLNDFSPEFPQAKLAEIQESRFYGISVPDYSYRFIRRIAFA
ncbi:hypothetical protein [Salmonella enterica]|uniref:hypothetical protein n=1 Tax=Salmonella enterica TaxID=28901 RepID=UPI00111ABC1F|nr:hypothetical protein [Salmonella enterica]EEJ9030924.1 hypothetical protein [Salmonella enterica subsp. enterica serovar Oslo]MBA3215953.1 hypothetical protein [Salmonella enterica]